MTDIFRVQLIPLDVGGTSADGLAPVVHVDLPLSARGAAAPPVDDASASAALLSRLHYGMASLVSELELGGRVLSSRCASDLEARCAPGHARTRDGGRLFFMRPVESGAWLLAAHLPARVWRCLGPAALHAIAATAVRGHDVPIASCIATDTAIATGSALLYRPLLVRLAESKEAVAAALRARLVQMADFASLLSASGRAEASASGAALREGLHRRAAAWRLCHCGPAGPLMAAAAGAVALRDALYAAWAGHAGLCGGPAVSPAAVRFVVTAAAVWFQGACLLADAGAEEFDLCLRPAALVALAESALDGGPPLTVRATAMGIGGTGRDIGRGVGGRGAAGYVLSCPPAAAGALCVAFATGGGWLLALRVEAAPGPFAGAPLPHIVNGVAGLIARTLETPRGAAMAEAQRMESRGAAPRALYSPAEARVQAQARHVAIVACAAAPGEGVLREVFLLRRARPRGDDEEDQDKEKDKYMGDDDGGEWPKHLRDAVRYMARSAAPALRLCSRSSRRRRRRSGADRVPSSALFSARRGTAMFAMLRGKCATLGMAALPVCDPTPRVVVFLAELATEEKVTVPEIRAFALWMLSKVT